MAVKRFQAGLYIQNFCILAYVKHDVSLSSHIVPLGTAEPESLPRKPSLVSQPPIGLIRKVYPATANRAEPESAAGSEAVEKRLWVCGDEIDSWGH
jgi:hypothetical protein